MAFIFKKQLSRRTFLRGTGVTTSLSYAVQIQTDEPSRLGSS